jgi:hypothetical protein
MNDSSVFSVISVANHPLALYRALYLILFEPFFERDQNP